MTYHWSAQLLHTPIIEYLCAKVMQQMLTSASINENLWRGQLRARILKTG